MSENIGFTDRCLSRLQRMSIGDGPFAKTLNAYLLRHGRLSYDVDRNLFWVRPPHGAAQVAVWMMPVCTGGLRK